MSDVPISVLVCPSWKMSFFRPGPGSIDGNFGFGSKLELF